MARRIKKKDANFERNEEKISFIVDGVTYECSKKPTGKYSCRVVMPKNGPIIPNQIPIKDNNKNVIVEEIEDEILIYQENEI